MSGVYEVVAALMTSFDAGKEAILESTNFMHLNSSGSVDAFESGRLEKEEVIVK